MSFEYEGLAKYLLGRILVVDNIENALVIARKYKYSLRIVTLEGEQLNPGGSMTGGAFKNSSNLLGRRREIEELKTEVSSISKTITETKASISELRSEVGKNRDNLDQLNKQQREIHIKKNTLDVTLKQADNKLKEIIDGSDNIVFFGGAGVSTESGVPDIRSEDGLYNQEYDYPPETILSHTFYRRNPEEFYRFYHYK